MIKFEEQIKNIDDKMASKYINKQIKYNILMILKILFNKKN